MLKPHELPLDVQNAHEDVYRRALKCSDPDVIEHVAEAFETVGYSHVAGDLRGHADALAPFGAHRHKRKHPKQPQDDTPPDDDASEAGFGCDAHQSHLGSEFRSGHEMGHEADMGEDDMGLGTIIPSYVAPPAPPQLPAPPSIDDFDLP